MLGLPADNYKGYVEADATQRARHIPSHSLYLIHGLADMSVPYQHSIELARALADAGVIYRYQAYADEGHRLEGVTEHLYRSMEHFLTECLSLDVDESAAGALQPSGTAGAPDPGDATITGDDAKKKRR